MGMDAIRIQEWQSISRAIEDSRRQHRQFAQENELIMSLVESQELDDEGFPKEIVEFRRRGIE